MVLLRFVDAREAGLILKEIHEGAFSTHMNGHSMAKKILRASYFLLTMENDCYMHVKKCEKCQTYADNILFPKIPLNKDHQHVKNCKGIKGT